MVQCACYNSDMEQVVKCKLKGVLTMTEREKELIELIRCQNKPGLALQVAIGIISNYLKLHGSSEEQAPADLQELA